MRTLLCWPFCLVWIPSYEGGDERLNENGHFFDGAWGLEVSGAER